MTNTFCMFKTVENIEKTKSYTSSLLYISLNPKAKLFFVQVSYLSWPLNGRNRCADKPLASDVL